MRVSLGRSEVHSLAFSEVKSHLWPLAAMITVPLAIMSAVLLLILTPGRDPGSGFGLAWPYILALGAGSPFAWRFVSGPPLVRAVVLILYFILGALALTWFWSAFNCARGLCL
jgi:hypothetical protein